MRVFAELCPALQIGQQPADQLPWFHIVTLLTKATDPNQRERYAIRAVERAWSRSTLQANIKAQLHLREGAAVTNFAQRLPEPQVQLAQEILRDPYHFDFLGLGDEAHERDIESALVRHITRFLLERLDGRIRGDVAESWPGQQLCLVRGHPAGPPPVARRRRDHLLRGKVPKDACAVVWAPMFTRSRRVRTAGSHINLEAKIEIQGLLAAANPPVVQGEVVDRDDQIVPVDTR